MLSRIDSTASLQPPTYYKKIRKLPIARTAMTTMTATA